MAQRLGHSVRIVANISGQGLDRIAGTLTDALNICLRVAVEDRPILGKRDLPGGVLGGLPIGILCAAIHVVDRRPRQLEGHPQFHQRLCLPLSGEDIFRRRRDREQVAGANRRQTNSTGTRHIDDAPAGEITFERSSGLFLDLCPRSVRDRCQLPMEVIHFVLLSAILSQVKSPPQGT